MAANQRVMIKVWPGTADSNTMAVRGPLRVLFVEPDTIVRRSLLSALRPVAPSWHLEVAGSFADARIALEGPFDVVLTELDLGDGEGLALLREVSVRSPETVRIVFTSMLSSELAADACRVAHRWIAKPAGRDDLTDVLRRIERVHLRNATPLARKVAAGVGDLPRVPATVAEITSLLRDDQASIEEVGRVVARDPGLTARVLACANSAFYGLPRRVVSPEQAAVYLGREALVGLVLSSAITVGYQDRLGGLASFVQDRALDVMGVTRLLIRLTRPSSTVSDVAQTASLLRDVGVLAVAVWDHLERDDAMALLDDRHLVDLEAEVGEVSAHLLSLWNLPESLTDAVELSERAVPAVEPLADPAAFVHAAAAVAAGHAHSLDPAWLESHGLAEAVADAALVGTPRAGGPLSAPSR